MKDNPPKKIEIHPTQSIAPVIVQKTPTTFSDSDSDFEKMKQWGNLKKEIKKLNDLPTNQHRTRRQQAQPILTKIMDPSFIQFLSKNPTALQEYVLVSQQLFQCININTDSIDSATERYFRNYFSSDHKEILTIRFSVKSGGIQLGKKMTITYTISGSKEQHEISYFIKTHQYGNADNTNVEKEVDPKELFVYKVFEYMGWGPKAHFFPNPLSEKSFYIATQDASFSKVFGKNKQFIVFKDLEKNLDEKSTLDTEKGITSIELLSRVFCLTDIITNPNNFGRVTVNDHRNKWKIIDFRVEQRSGYVYRDIFEGFSSGNGMHNYHGHLAKVLRNPEESKRMATANQAIIELEIGKVCQSRTGTKMSLIEAIDKAFFDIVKYIKNNTQIFETRNLRTILGDLGSFDLKKSTDADLLTEVHQLPLAQLGDLGKYLRGIKENFFNLKEGIRRRHLELSSTPEKKLTPTLPQ